MAIDCCAISKQDQSFLLTGNSHVILQNDSHVNLEPSHVNLELSHVMFPHVVFSHVILQYYSHVNLEHSHVTFSHVTSGGFKFTCDIITCEKTCVFFIRVLCTELPHYHLFGVHEVSKIIPLWCFRHGYSI